MKPRIYSVYNIDALSDLDLIRINHNINFCHVSLQEKEAKEEAAAGVHDESVPGAAAPGPRGGALPGGKTARPPQGGQGKTGLDPPEAKVCAICGDFEIF